METEGGGGERAGLREEVEQEREEVEHEREEVEQDRERGVREGTEPLQPATLSLGPSKRDTVHHWGSFRTTTHKLTD